ncbi:hypothetical protein NDU88_005281 [Pleurodeles waltl]|uniref:t-SNARE coiled-coil homology domain-containing protein n=1 Tax=Pleurodeles waltl TaxID=8319 RepID=A0AAV7SL73_PLEWA|nr:hypothetical protein NDU88_005281 [Pleurodeles waltl]
MHLSAASEIQRRLGVRLTAPGTCGEVRPGIPPGQNSKATEAPEIGRPCALARRREAGCLEKSVEAAMRTSRGETDTRGKADKAQAKLHFERRKTVNQAGDGIETEPEKTSEVPAHEDQDLRHILAAMQQSLTQIDGKIDSLSSRMDRMSERLDKQVEHLDQTERRVSTVEDGQTALATGQLKISTELGTLKTQDGRLGVPLSKEQPSYCGYCGVHIDCKHGELH